MKRFLWLGFVLCFYLICSGCGGGPIVVGCCAMAELNTPATNKAASAAVKIFFFCIVVSP